MKAVLIMIIFGVGNYNVPTIATVKFDNATACERAAKSFREVTAPHSAAFCTEDRF